MSATTSDHVAALAALYGRHDAETMRRQLPELADRLHAQLCELAQRPTPDGAERLAQNLGRVVQHVLRLREVLMREVAG